VPLDGEPAAPRAVLRHGLDAADFDEQSGGEIVDRTKAAGDAVTPVGGGAAELVYRHCDFGAGVTEVTVEVAGEGVVELSLDAGPALAELALPAPTSGPYHYLSLSAGIVAEGVHDVHLRLRGPLRLAHVGFSG
jgi:beta-glucosidase